MKFLYTITGLIILASCTQPAKRLPVLGNATIIGNEAVYPKIASFSLVDQDGRTVTNETFGNKVYVADFIFLSCPTICPTMTNAMHKAYLAFASDTSVGFISHTIDPDHDTIPRLKAFADDLGISSDKWRFVTGNQDSIMNLSEHSYFSTTFPDSTSPGGFTHSGGLLLVDKNRHIRGVYNSQNPAEGQRLIYEIQLLLKEQL